MSNGLVVDGDGRQCSVGVVVVVSVGVRVTVMRPPLAALYGTD